MKIQLDTTNKTIKIEENVLLSKLVDTLDSLLPNKEWKKYTLETNTTINHWHEPYVIRERYREPFWPSSPWITYMSTTKDTLSLNRQELKAGSDYSVKSGVFNVELT